MSVESVAGSRESVADLVEAARRHLISPAEEMAKLGTVTKPFLTSGNGVYVTDSKGHQLIDGPGGMWCTQIGYNRREIADAISAQALRLSFNSPGTPSTAHRRSWQGASRASRRATSTTCF